MAKNGAKKARAGRASKNESPAKNANAGDDRKTAATPVKEEPFSLASLGIQAVAVTPNTAVNKDCKIMLTQVLGLGGMIAVTFRNIDKNNQNGPYPQHLFFTAIRARAAWTEALNIASNVPRLHNNNEVVLTPNGKYKYSVFMIPIQANDVLPHSSMMAIASEISKKLMDVPGNKCKVIVDTEDLYFVEPGEAVVSDFLSHDDCIQMIMKNATFSGDFYEINKDLIHNFFHYGTMTVKVAQELKCPVDEIAEEFRDQLEEAADDEENLDLDEPEHEQNLDEENEHLLSE